MKLCLIRHGETAWSLSGLHTGLTDLSEWDYGRYEGLRCADIRRENPGWNIWRDGCPGGESPADVVSARADRLIARIGAMNGTMQGTLALFSHGQFGAALAARWIGLALVEGQHFALRAASVSLLGISDATRRASTHQQYRCRVPALDVEVHALVLQRLRKLCGRSAEFLISRRQRRHAGRMLQTFEGHHPDPQRHR